MTDSSSITPIAFSHLNLHPLVLQGVQDAGFTLCTPIQAQTLPIMIAGTDVAGQAQTGTGKTAAFLLATMHHLLTAEPSPQRRADQPRALILAPTRELAIQIHRDALLFGRHTQLSLALAYGGTGYEQQRQDIAQGVDILIGTPGRIIDYFKQHVFDLKALQVIVLDEADRMFDLGFIKEIRYLLRHMPHPDQRLSMLFSATLSYRVLELAYEHMNNPQLVVIDPDRRAASRIRQRLYHLSEAEKLPALIGLLRQAEQGRVMVFVNTKRTGEQIQAQLLHNEIAADLISGDVPQKKRQRLLKQFHTGETKVLVATDVAARGLHIPDVSHVINYDLPQDPEDYVHRIGRTARAGSEGDAISLCCERYCYALPDIEQYLGERIPTDSLPEALLATPVSISEVAPGQRRAPRSSRGGRARSRR
jgi:ATP-dependent RNA helicase RhlB